MFKFDNMSSLEILIHRIYVLKFENIPQKICQFQFLMLKYFGYSMFTK